MEISWCLSSLEAVESTVVVRSSSECFHPPAGRQNIHLYALAWEVRVSHRFILFIIDVRIPWRSSQRSVRPGMDSRFTGLGFRFLGHQQHPSAFTGPRAFLKISSCRLSHTLQNRPTRLKIQAPKSKTVFHFLFLFFFFFLTQCREQCQYCKSCVRVCQEIQCKPPAMNVHTGSVPVL